MTPMDDNQRFLLSRRTMLSGIAAAVGCALLPSHASAEQFTPSAADEAFLDDLQRQACLFYWEQGSEKTGQVLDRARNDLNGKRDPRRMASIAATGFGLSALCIAHKRGYLPKAQIEERVKNTLHWHLNAFPEVHGFYYHFSDIETGVRVPGVELSSIDTALLLCGVRTAEAYFEDRSIKHMARQIYERVDWPWMLNGGKTFSMGWHPDKGFLDARWEHYCELMMIYLLAIGSPTHPVDGSYWNNFTRPVIHYKQYSYVSGNDPLFTHQYSQAWYDFRGKRDKYTNYFDNSVIATKAHKDFCLSYPKWYNDDYWGITASDYKDGYTAWGGPPPQGPLDGTVVPCAAGGSLAFVPKDCLHVLRAMRDKWGKQAWGRYGFVDAFHPAANWYDTDVLGIDQGITVVMAENLRSGLIWKTFMSLPESTLAMKRAGFHGRGLA
ncbi:MAG TPA: glucoamylase family protein [Terracidiphilus sp.]|nr:glucoamylase family protein [Terracidiphilus sp.]